MQSPTGKKKHKKGWPKWCPPEVRRLHELATLRIKEYERTNGPVIGKIPRKEKGPMDSRVFLLPKEGDQLGRESCWEMWSHDPHDAYRCDNPAVIRVQGVPFCAEHAKKRAAELAKEAAEEISSAVLKETVSARILGLLR